MASGINSTFRQVGIATGIAVLGSIFQSAIQRHLTPLLAGTPAAGHAAGFARAVAAGGAQRAVSAVPGAHRAQATVAIHSAFTGAMNDILLVAGLVAFAGAALALVLVRGRDFVAYGAPEAAPAGAHAG
jgi:hypothetical protein